MMILDTNICIYAINQRSADVIRRLATRATRHDVVGVSAITVAELEYGIAKSQHIERNRAALERFLTPLEIVPFEGEAASHYGAIRSWLEAHGTPIGPNDLFIAAHARSLAATLLTNNAEEFERVPDLIVDDWSKRS
jgi:tRNA(fMet)-specific endonuclease VapC